MECTPHQRLDPKPSKSAIQAASHQRNPSRPNSHQPWAMAASSDRHQRSEPIDHEQAPSIRGSKRRWARTTGYKTAPQLARLSRNRKQHPPVVISSSSSQMQ
ncbi:hypothetical protein ACLOJK_018744 [Asimina triloba]